MFWKLHIVVIIVVISWVLRCYHVCDEEQPVRDRPTLQVWKVEDIDVPRLESRPVPFRLDHACQTLRRCAPALDRYRPSVDAVVGGAELELERRAGHDKVVQEGARLGPSDQIASEW